MHNWIIFRIEPSVISLKVHRFIPILTGYPVSTDDGSLIDIFNSLVLLSSKLPVGILLELYIQW